LPPFENWLSGAKEISCYHPVSGLPIFPRFSRPNILYKTVRGIDLVEERFRRFDEELISSTFSTETARSTLKLSDSEG
jgi:hypothetical protein